MKAEKVIKIVLSIIGLITLFHFAIILKIIPYEITWGGRLENDSEMYVFEAISILINLILIFAMLIKGKFIRQIIPSKIVTIILWIFVVIFCLNTIGNLFAETYFEKSFSLITLLLSILIWVIIKSKNNK